MLPDLRGGVRKFFNFRYSMSWPEDTSSALMDSFPPAFPCPLQPPPPWLTVACGRNAKRIPGPDC